jgi:hypothetical protein
MRPLTILPTDGKGRAFSAACLATVEASGVWTSDRTDDTRPVWAMFAGSDAEMRAFVANLQMGKKAVFGSGSERYKRGDRLELLRSAGYTFAWQRDLERDVSIATAFLPDLFRMDPGMVDPGGVSFVCLPTQAWVDAQRFDPSDLAAAVQHGEKLNTPHTVEQLAALVPMAFLFAVYLDRRTQAPLLADGRFYLQILLASLADGMASWPLEGSYYSRHDHEWGINGALGFRCIDTVKVGLARGLAFSASHATIEAFLAREVATFFSLQGGGKKA